MNCLWLYVEDEVVQSVLKIDFLYKSKITKTKNGFINFKPINSLLPMVFVKFLKVKPMCFV